MNAVAMEGDGVRVISGDSKGAIKGWCARALRPGPGAWRRRSEGNTAKQRDRDSRWACVRACVRAWAVCMCQSTADARARNLRPARMSPASVRRGGPTAGHGGATPRDCRPRGAVVAAAAAGLRGASEGRHVTAAARRGSAGTCGGGTTRRCGRSPTTGWRRPSLPDGCVIGGGGPTRMFICTCLCLCGVCVCVCVCFGLQFH